MSLHKIAPAKPEEIECEFAQDGCKVI